MTENEGRLLMKSSIIRTKDGRELVGKIICYDNAGNLILSEVSETVDPCSLSENTNPLLERPINIERFLTTCMVPCSAIKQLKLRYPC
mmetsp:Transcript_38772/g.61410  ORF Transcript_38772/g.61410 Transcript_38772/m.61410 type:complete len:88 (+) Transcript_38772:39-302(+)